MMHAFLMVGQSNMAGRGKTEEVEKIENPKIFVQRMGRWRTLLQPINSDGACGGITLAESFADAYSKDHPDVDVGLIPCAFGGSPIEWWAEDENLFVNAINNVHLAAKNAEIKGILWHQGESDCILDRQFLYEERLFDLINNFRKDKLLKDAPFIMGEIGYFLKDYPEGKYKEYQFINDVMKKVVDRQTNCALVSAVGLGSNPDKLHFNAVAQRELGLRYYEALKNLHK